MSIKNEMTRLTIDLPKEEHRRLKRISADCGKSMRELVLEAIQTIDNCPYGEHIPNKTTIKAMRDAQAGHGLIKGKEAEEISKKFGI